MEQLLYQGVAQISQVGFLVTAHEDVVRSLVRFRAQHAQNENEAALECVCSLNEVGVLARVPDEDLSAASVDRKSELVGRVIERLYITAGVLGLAGLSSSNGNDEDAAAVQDAAAEMAEDQAPLSPRISRFHALVAPEAPAAVLSYEERQQQARHQEELELKRETNIKERNTQLLQKFAAEREEQLKAEQQRIVERERRIAAEKAEKEAKKEQERREKREKAEAAKALDLKREEQEKIARAAREQKAAQQAQSIKQEAKQKEEKRKVEIDSQKLARAALEAQAERERQEKAQRQAELDATRDAKARELEQSLLNKNKEYAQHVHALSSKRQQEEAWRQAEKSQAAEEARLRAVQSQKAKQDARMAQEKLDDQRARANAERELTRRMKEKEHVDSLKLQHMETVKSVLERKNLELESKRAEAEQSAAAKAGLQARQQQLDTKREEHIRKMAAERAARDLEYASNMVAAKKEAEQKGEKKGVEAEAARQEEQQKLSARHKSEAEKRAATEELNKKRLDCEKERDQKRNAEEVARMQAILQEEERVKEDKVKSFEEKRLREKEAKEVAALQTRIKKERWNELESKRQQSIAAREQERQLRESARNPKRAESR